MKFNLRNRPKLKDGNHDIREVIQANNQAQAWFVGFEKQLREKLRDFKENVESMEGYPKIIPWVAINEILGEKDGAKH